MKVFRIYISIFIILLCSGYAGATENKLFIPQQQWAKFSKGYDYTEHIKVSKSKHELKPSKPWFPNLAKGGYILKFIFWGLVVLILLVIIILLITKIFTGNNEKVVNNKSFQSITIDNIEDANLEDFLSQSITNGSYKDAIRIQYLMIIRTLNGFNLVIWKKDKTNGAYLVEMYGKKGFDLFRLVTLSFERTWYGDKEIGENEYHHLIPLFDQLHEKVTSNE